MLRSRKVLKLCELLFNMHLKTLPNFIRTLMGILISGFQDLAAAQPSVLQDLRAFLFYSIPMLVVDLA